MKSPLVEVCYVNGVFTMPSVYTPPPDRFTSTPGDNIAELSGRVCYASINAGTRGRPTAEYHTNLLSTSHNSVYAHTVETFEVVDLDDSSTASTQVIRDVLDVLHCRPGVWVTKIGRDKIRFAISLRAVMEWNEHGVVFDHPVRQSDKEDLYVHLLEELKPLYPLALSTAPTPVGIRYDPAEFIVKRVAPELPKEKWCSLYLAGVSRDFLQELVRHRWQANPSVESTRYVDKENTDFIDHPAVDEDLKPGVEESRNAARRAYRYIYTMLTSRGIDKKTARGAARSYLPGATETRLVFSLSLFQARHLLSLRLHQSTGSVDPETQRAAGLIRDTLKTVWPELEEG